MDIKDNKVMVNFPDYTCNIASVIKGLIYMKFLIVKELCNYYFVRVRHHYMKLPVIIKTMLLVFYYLTEPQ